MKKMMVTPIVPCFRAGLDPESVSRHRLNIAELSKLEHDMYLMGVTIASLDTSEENHRHKERRRVRAHYRFMVSVLAIAVLVSSYIDK